MLHPKSPKLPALAKSKSKSKSKAKSKSKSKSETKTKSRIKAKYRIGSGSGQGQNPAQLEKLRRELRDEDVEIHTLGSDSEEEEVLGDRAHMINRYLSREEVFALFGPLERKKEQKALGNSLNELQLEEEEEAEEEEVEEEEEGEQSYKICKICSKEYDHWTIMCPWLDELPDGATVGSGYAVACKCCDTLGGHPDIEWTGRAIPTRCGICEASALHWTEDCPKWPSFKEKHIAEFGDGD